MQSKSKHLLLLALGLIALVYVGAAAIAYRHFSTNVLKNEMSSQQKMTRIVNQSMTRYFETLKFVVENAVLHSAFDPSSTVVEDAIRFKKNDPRSSLQQMQKNGIAKMLSAPRATLASDERITTGVENWKIFKGLPELDAKGELIAKERRIISRNILKSFKDIHYVFEMDPNGDLVFLEPFDTQKNITSFNYEFRDYLRMVKSTRVTAISEGYISHDQNRTQIITVATPVFDGSGKVAKVFAVSVSANTLRERVFRALKENLDLRDGTTFYLVDRHAHIVASSSGKNIYFPKEGEKEDEHDLGNLRFTGFFKNIDWTPDVLEKGNIWERNTKSWLVSSLNRDYSGEYKNLNGVDVFSTLFPTPIIGVEATNWGILVETPISQLLASKAYLKQVFYVSSFVLLAILLALSIMTLKNFSRLETQLTQKQIEVEQIASQVAHDIRSPLAALDMITGNLSQLSEDKRILVRSAVNRIKDIANNLLSKKTKVSVASRPKPSAVPAQTTCQLVSSMIDEIVTEKRLQFRAKLGVEIAAHMDSASYGLFVEVSPSEFKRVISNLLNNSIEAVGENGKVEVACTRNESSVEISIVDNGKGIPADILPSLMQKGSTFGKKEGTGLGLYHARTSIEAWGGSITLSSKLGHGTKATIALPSVLAPKWFVPSLELKEGQKIAALDDDTSVHQIWSKQFNSAMHDGKINVELFHFSTPIEFTRWVEQNLSQDLLCLVDFELLGQSLNGLAIIESLGIQKNSILVTSRYDEPFIRQNCARLGVRLLPKGMAGFVPINISRKERNATTSFVQRDQVSPS